MKRAALFVGVMLLVTISIQPPFACTGDYMFPVAYPMIDGEGIAPRAAVGSENLFNCIADNDPDFESQRFPDESQAQTYWFNLVLQELDILPPSPPSTPFDKPLQLLKHWVESLSGNG